MAEKCTNTSSPVERWMNPYPFAPLNHLTVPFSLTEKLLSPIAKNNSPASSIVAPVDRSPPQRSRWNFARCPRGAEDLRQNKKDSSVRSRAETTRHELWSPEI